MITWKLTLAGMRNDRARTLSGVCGIAAAVAILAWQIGLATTAIHQSATAVESATAPYSAWVLGPSQGGPGMPPRGGNAPAADAPAPRGKDRAEANAAAGGRRQAGHYAPVPAPIAASLANAPETASLLALDSRDVTIDARPNGRVRQGPPLRGVVAALPESPNALALPFATASASLSTEPEAAAQGAPSLGDASVLIARSLARRADPSLSVGSPLLLVLGDHTATLTIAGFFDTTDLVKEFPQLYVSTATFRALFGPEAATPDTANLLLVATRPGTDPAALGYALDTCPPALADACRLVTRAAVQDRFRSDTVSNLLRSLPLSLTLVTLTAAALLLTLLSMGLAAHRRLIAELRCAGMTRMGVVRLTLAEAMAILLPGWLLGLLVAALVLQLFLLFERSADLPRLVYFGWQTPLYTLLFALVVGLLAALRPAFQAARVRPLELRGPAFAAPRRLSLPRSLLGLLLLLPLPLLGLLPGIPAAARSPLLILLGVPLFACGTLLLLHAVMRLTEHLFLRPLAWLLHLHPTLLARRLSRDPSRSRGLVLTLALGLGAFIAIHIWGATLMSAFVPSPEWPDVIVSVLPSGYTPTQADLAMHVPGFSPPATPLLASQFPLDATSADLLRSRGAAPDGQLLLLGADPADYLGPAPIAPFRFAQGSPEDARAAFQAFADAAPADASIPAPCLVPALTAHALRLRLGDTLSLAGRSFQLVGILDLNWHMVTSRAQLRTRSGRLDTPSGGAPQHLTKHPARAAGALPPASPPARTLGLLLTSPAAASPLIGAPGHEYFFWGNFAPEFKTLHPLAATVRLDAQIRAAVGPDSASTLQVHHRDEIADGTLSHGSDILGTMARIPFWSLVVTASGIAVLLIASATLSRREFATMRALGMTRSQLARLLLGEALLVALAAILVSLLLGILFGWSFTGLGGAAWSLPLTFAFPVAQTLRGTGFLLLLTFLFALIPLPRLLRSF